MSDHNWVVGDIVFQPNHGVVSKLKLISTKVLDPSTEQEVVTLTLESGDEFLAQGCLHGTHAQLHFSNYCINIIAKALNTIVVYGATVFTELHPNTVIKILSGVVSRQAALLTQKEGLHDHQAIEGLSDSGGGRDSVHSTDPEDRIRQASERESERSGGKFR